MLVNQWFLSLSGRRDSNPRPPAPKAGALTGLRYAPLQIRLFPFCECKGNNFILIYNHFALFFCKNFMEFGKIGRMML